MNFFAALTCTIFAWGLAEGSKVFLRNFQSVEAIFHRTRRTHSNDRFGTNIRGCSGLRCTNQANGILQGVQLSPLHQQSRRQSCARLVHFLLWQAAKPSGDKCTPFISPPHAAGRSALRVRSLPRRAAAAWLHPSPCGLPP